MTFYGMHSIKRFRCLLNTFPWAYSVIWQSIGLTKRNLYTILSTLVKQYLLLPNIKKIQKVRQGNQIDFRNLYFRKEAIVWLSNDIKVLSVTLFEFNIWGLNKNDVRKSSHCVVYRRFLLFSPNGSNSSSFPTIGFIYSNYFYHYSLTFFLKHSTELVHICMSSM